MQWVHTAAFLRRLCCSHCLTNERRREEAQRYTNTSSIKKYKPEQQVASPEKNLNYTVGVFLRASVLHFHVKPLLFQFVEPVILV